MAVNARDVYGLADGQILWGEVMSNLCRSTFGYYIYSDTVDDNNYLRVVPTVTGTMAIRVMPGKIEDKSGGDAGTISVTAAITHAISTGNVSYARYDLVVWDASGSTIDVVEGTPGAIPNPPSIGAVDDYPLGLVYVSTGEATSIGTADITDLRVLRYSAAP